MAPRRNFLRLAAALIEADVPDRGALVWSGDGRQVFERHDDQCGGATVTVVAAGAETVNHVCGVDPGVLR